MSQSSPPRVELERGQHHVLEKLSERSGQTVEEIVRQAVDRYLLEVEDLDHCIEEQLPK